MDFGLISVPFPKRTGRMARGFEELGFASVLLTDSQNLCPDVWGHLMLAAAATSRIRLGPGVTNPVTRDPATTAGAALSLQAESDGRAILAIGRGDSAVQRIGRREQPVAEFERTLEQLQAYLSGEAVDRDGFASRLEWMRRLPELPKVPLEVMATGPRVIEAAARRADRVCLAMGADPEHLAGALARARRAAAEAGRDADAVSYGACVNCAVSDDLAAARDAIRGSATSFARFSAFRGNDLDALPEPLRKAALHIREHYDMKDHTRSGAAHARGIEDGFLDWFAITGTAEGALPRFRALADLGLDFVHVVSGSGDVGFAAIAASLRAIAVDVAPHFQGGRS